MDTTRAFIDEFARLRQGWGLEATNLSERVGPRLRALCGVRPGDADRIVRQKVTGTVDVLANRLSGVDRLTAVVALGAVTGMQHPRLTDREAVLAQRLRCSERTARRHVERAFVRLAEEAAAHRPPPNADPDLADPEVGWTVRRLTALLRLDTPVPELIERRTIVAEYDGLKRIAARFSLPPVRDGSPGVPDLYVDVQQGARVRHRERQGRAHFRYLLDLPRALASGEEHSYTMAFRVPDRQPIRPHYAYVPLVACRSFRLRARFDPRALPRAVWTLDRLPPRVLDDHAEPGAPPPQLDDAGEVALDFDRPEPGFAYGIGWLPAEPPDTLRA